MKAVPVKIKPHLIPFLFNELEGDSSATTEDKKVKLVRITKRSTMGMILIILQERVTPDYDLEKITGHEIFLTVEKNIKGNKATLFRKVNNTVFELMLHPDDVDFFNEFLEDLFRITLVSYVQGYAAKPNDNQVRYAVYKYMELHELFQYEVDPESLRRMYYTALKKKHLLQRIQRPVNNYNGKQFTA